MFAKLASAFRTVALISANLEQPCSKPVSPPLCFAYTPRVCSANSVSKPKACGSFLKKLGIEVKAGAFSAGNSAAEAGEKEAGQQSREAGAG
jgi:hypothetical protein